MQKSARVHDREVNKCTTHKLLACGIVYHFSDLNDRLKLKIHLTICPILWKILFLEFISRSAISLQKQIHGNMGKTVPSCLLLLPVRLDDIKNLADIPTLGLQQVRQPTPLVGEAHNLHLGQRPGNLWVFCLILISQVLISNCH